MKVALWFLCALSLAGLAGAVFIWTGAYDISANRQHTQLVYSLLETTMHRSVKMRASQTPVPPLASDTTRARGGVCFVQKCVQCHGGPGTAQSDIGRSMQPLPGPLVDASRKWTPAELYWITRNGIKMSGMPAWQHRMTDDDLWAVVAFLQQLPALTAADFRSRAVLAETAPRCSAASHPDAGPDTVRRALRVADPERGRAALTQYACNSCHRIPGVTGSEVAVGPPLKDFANQQLIAGAIPNDARNLVRWIREPQSIDPETTMPNMQVDEHDANDIAAYLLTLR